MDSQYPLRLPHDAVEILATMHHSTRNTAADTSGSGSGLTSGTGAGTKTSLASSGDLPSTTSSVNTTLSSTISNLQNNNNDLALLSRNSDILGSFAPSSRSMETLSFDPGHDHGHAQHQHQHYMTSNYGIGTQPHFANHLGILNAESFDDSFGRSQEASRRSQHDPVLPFGIADTPELRIDLEGKTNSDEYEKGGGSGNGRRKKHRIEAEVADEEEDARKKARGRPRVDTKDETAADRRRTQIRMAQRAYRHRKETTITSLEKKVQDLRGTNEEMSNIFISLYDFAIGQGLLQREPEFGQQLQSTTQRFLALAKSNANDEASQDEQHEESEKQAEPEPSRRTKVRRTSPKKQREEIVKTVEQPTNPYGGYIGTLSASGSPVEDITMENHLQTFEHRPRTNHQVITRPTEENASFPFDLMDLQQFRVDIPPMDDYSAFFPRQELPLPKTHSYGEFSFARRIQRAALERACLLIEHPERSQKRYQEVFGLTLMYSTPEKTAARLKKLLESTEKESLQNWRNPFVHIGGSGTFYPNYDGEIEMPKFRTGYSMGPFSPAISQAQEHMQDGMICDIPGFKGEFFDANDVEGYLRGRGIEIPAAADFVTAELDASVVAGAFTPRSDSIDTLPTEASPKTPASPVDLMNMNAAMTQNYDYTKTSANSFPFPITLWSSGGAANNGGTIDPIFGAGSDQRVLNQSPELINEQTLQHKRSVIVNVNVLLEGILSHAVCLGRAPGFRVADINAAIVAAVKHGI